MELKRFYLVASAMLLALMASCSQDAVESVNDSFFEGATRANGKPLEIDYSALDTYYFVTDKDVESYIHFKKLLAESEKREFEVREVVTLGLNDEATLAYLLNYNDGWEIIAADKRAQRALATDEKGSFDMKEAPEAVVAWIENLEMQVLYLRSCADRPEWASDETWSKMLESIDFWRAINADEDFIMEHMGDTRGHGGLIPDPIPIDSIIIDPMIGHWVLSNIRYSTATVTSSHLISTHWHQLEDYNRYCPSKTIGTGNAPAGCGPVAVAQMEYFLHKKIGKPILCPSEIFCTANTSNFAFGVNMYISNTSTTLWNSMGSDTDAAAKLIAGCGIKAQAHYGNTGTSTTAINLYNTLTSDGIICNGVNYSTNIVKQSLENNMPVLTCAGGVQHDNDTIGHAFIIDRYRGIADQYTYCYEWVVDVPGDGTSMHPLYKENIVVDYESTEITQFGMNWGWQSTTYDGMWFTPSSTWVINEDYYIWGNSTAVIIHNFR